MPTRFFFEPPRPKAKPKSNIKSLLVRCPTTSRLTDTGETIDERLWPNARVKNKKVNCAHCGSVHTWNKSDVVLSRPTRPSR